jgi:hypothetical protein
VIVHADTFGKTEPLAAELPVARGLDRSAYRLIADC